MGRGPKPGKGKAKPAVPRKSRANEDSKVRDLEKRLEEAREQLQTSDRERAEARDQQTATADILRVISSSPADVQPVFETIVTNAARLCDAADTTIFQIGPDALILAAHHGPIPSLPVGALRPLVPGAPSGRAVLEARIIHNLDLQSEVDEYPEGSALARRLDYRACLSVPLVRAGVAIGVIVIRRIEARPFTERQIVIVKSFAAQAVIAVENVRLFKELQEKNTALTRAHAQVSEALEQQTATAEILSVISSSPTDVQPVFDTIVASAVRLCRAQIGVVYRFDGELLHLVAYHNLTPAMLDALRSLYPRQPQPDVVSGRAILSRAVVQIEDVLADREFHQGLALATSWRSMVAVPMLREAEPIGAIVINRIEPGAFADHHLALLKTFADQAVIAIENVRLFTELQEKNRELTQALDRETATGEILRVINSSPTSVDPVFDAILTRGMRLCQADVGLLILTEGDMFRLVADRGAPPDFVEPRRIAFRSGPHTGLTRAVRERRPIQIEDLLSDRAYTERDPTRLQTVDLLGARTGVWVPLLKEDKAVGVLVTWRREFRPFTLAEIDVLTTFANQAVIALENIRLLRELELKSRQLEAASQHKSDFLANMSHELRTPLNAIIGFSEVLADRMFGELNDKQEEYLKDIYASGTHLLSLINDILDLSKIEAGRMELELTDFDLPTALDNALMLIRERAGRRSIALQADIDPRLGQVQADERKIRQVVLNLLSNAIKFTPEGGRIDVSAVPKDGFVEVSVSDTGIGIAPEDQEKVFEEFRQVGTSDKKAEGTGLGLTLCRKFIELHGGKIGLKSQVGVGSTFTFTIPVHRHE